MSELHYRSFASDLQVRPHGDGRTIYGIAVPYKAPVRIDHELVEQFARGAFNHQLREPSRVRFSREHALLGGTLIGAASELRDDAAGLYVELRASRTPVGDETLELIKDGALRQLSIHFEERQNRRLPGNIIERVKANLREVASVMDGAYGDLAVAAGVRSRGYDDQEPIDADLRAQAESFLMGLPELEDTDTKVRAIQLGISF